MSHCNTHKISVLHIMLIISILYVLLLRFNILLKCSRMSNSITDYGKLSRYWLLYWSQYLHFALVRTTISNHTIIIKPRTWNLFNRLPVWERYPLFRLPIAIIPISPVLRLINKRLRLPSILTYSDVGFSSLRRYNSAWCIVTVLFSFICSMAWFFYSLILKLYCFFVRDTDFTCRSVLPD